MKNFDEYNEENILKLLDHIRELSSEGRLVITQLIHDIQKRIAKYNKSRSFGTNAEKAYSRTTLYDRMKNRSRLLSGIGRQAFFETVDYLSERGLLEVEVTKHNIYPAVHDFLKISEENKSRAGLLTTGFFKTYRPSISKPNHVVVGLLEIDEDEKGYLRTEEVVPYRVNPNERRRRQLFTGHIWHTCGYYIFLTTDTNTKFMQSLILRSAYIDGEVGREQIRTMEGSYSGVTTQRGNRIFTSSIYLERIYDKPFTSGWFRMLRTLGSKKKNEQKQHDQVPESIWKIINPEINENLHFF